MNGRTVALALLLTLAACGGDDGPSGGIDAAPTPAELTATVEGMGTVIASVNGTQTVYCTPSSSENCADDALLSGDTVAISAAPSLGYRFDSWEGTGLPGTFDLESSAPQEFTATGSIAITGTFVVQSVTCTPTGTAPAGPPTAITATPTGACRGGRTTISASNVSNDGNACVEIGGVAVEIDLSGGGVSAAVPETATPGVAKIVVTTTGGTGMSAADFTVSAGTLPDITLLQPTTAAAAATVTVTGTDLTGATIQMFGPTTENPVVTPISATSVSFVVPNTVTAGSYDIYATVPGCGGSNTSLTLIVP